MTKEEKHESIKNMLIVAGNELCRKLKISPHVAEQIVPVTATLSATLEVELEDVFHSELDKEKCIKTYLRSLLQAMRELAAKIMSEKEMADEDSRILN